MSEMPHREKAVNITVEITKQILFLSTGAIALSITFFDKIVNGNYVILIVGWVLLIISTLFGILYICILAGMLHRNDEDIYANKPRITFGIHLVLFFLGLVSLSAFLIFQTVDKAKSDHKANLLYSITSENQNFSVKKLNDTLKVRIRKDSLEFKLDLNNQK